MANLTFEQIARAAEQLTPEERVLLIKRMQAITSAASSLDLTREGVLAEFERRKTSGAFDTAGSLRNKYAQPASSDLTDKQLRADIHEAATEWEKELDELFDDD